MSERQEENLLTGERGSAMVELAISAPILCLLFVGSIEFHKLTFYKRHVIAATRYACWECVYRKGEADLDKTVAKEVHDLYFPELTIDPANAVVGAFPNDSSGSHVQLKVTRGSSEDDLKGAGYVALGTMLYEAGVKGFKIGPFPLGGFGLVDPNGPDDRVTTEVRITYQPTFFPILLSFYNLKKSKTPTGADKPGSWDSAKNLFTLGGSKPYSRMVLCNGCWDEYRKNQMEEKIRGMWCPVLGEILSQLNKITFGLFEFSPYVEMDQICPYTAPNWWEGDCKCTHSEGSRFQNGGTAEDPNASAAAEKAEFEAKKAELQQRIADDQSQIDALTAERNARLNDNDPNNDNVSDLDSQISALTNDRNQAQSDLNKMAGH